MYVKCIDWIDKDAKEALVSVTDGTYECLAFCHPCRIEIGNSLFLPLCALDARSVVLVDYLNDTNCSGISDGTL
jgi:hypothetical protein